MNLGIVGHEAAKFNAGAEKHARWEIQRLLDKYNPEKVISGGCHLGGVDIFAVEEAKLAGIETIERLPKIHSWDGGYKQRNQKIAEDSDVVVCIVVKELPEGYTGMRFDRCYHCNTTSHVKSGGCWTVKYARKIGKTGEVIEI